jgi:hypothetical protein
MMRSVWMRGAAGKIMRFEKTLQDPVQDDMVLILLTKGFNKILSRPKNGFAMVERRQLPGLKLMILTTVCFHRYSYTSSVLKLK